MGIQVNFSTLILSIASIAMDNLGVKDESKINLDIAKQNIDILLILKEKTKGNLTDEEKTLLDNIIQDLQLLFVKKSKN